MMKNLNRYDHGQLNIKLPENDYRILASQDNKWVKFTSSTKVHLQNFFLSKKELNRNGLNKSNSLK